MWNKRYLLLALLLPFNAKAEIVCALGSGSAAYKIAEDQRPTGDAMEMARRLNTAMLPICSPKCPQIAIFRNSTAANAMLVVTPDQAKFVYAPQFFQSLYDNYGDGAIIAIIAHEFGHALDEINPDKFGRGGTPELRADAWAGCTVAKLDLSSNGLAETLDRRLEISVSRSPGVAAPAGGFAAGVYAMRRRWRKIRRCGHGKSTGK